ncbi:MAG: cysteine desulfurase family protein [Chitinophagales bacterium]
MIYFDHAATTPLAPEVLEEMLPYMQDFYGNASSIHAMGRRSRTAIERARKIIAGHLNASIGEIFFTSCGTESSNMALTAAIRDWGVKHIVSSPIEHHCVFHTIDALEKYGEVQKHAVRLLPNGHVDLTHLEEMLQLLQNESTLVSLMHVNNEIGNILDLQTVSKLCEQYGAYLHSDTVQTWGFERIDVQAMKVNFLTGSAHKFHGPKGIGFIYVNSDYPIQPFLLGGSQERNMRAGTENVYGIVGMAKAFDLAYKHLEENQVHILGLKNKMMTALRQAIPAISFNGDAEGRSSYKILNVAFPSLANADLLLLNLDIAGICASGGSACSSGVDKGSHVLQALQGADSTTVNVRFSFSRYNTEEEVDKVVDKLKEILKVA